MPPYIAGINMSRQQASSQVAAWRSNQPAPQDAAATFQVITVQLQSIPGNAFMTLCDSPEMVELQCVAMIGPKAGVPPHVVSQICE